MNDELLPFVADISSVPTADLRKELAANIGVTAKALARMAVIWGELERRGEDLSSLRSGLMAYMPAIAAGELLPEAVVRCAGQMTVLKMLSGLPLDQQQRLLEKGVPVLELDSATGTTVAEQVPVERLTLAQARRALAAGHVREPAEQAALLLPRAKSAAATVRGKEVTLRLTQEEYRKLRERAAAAGKRVPVFVREQVLGEE